VVQGLLLRRTLRPRGGSFGSSSFRPAFCSVSRRFWRLAEFQCKGWQIDSRASSKARNLCAEPFTFRRSSPQGHTARRMSSCLSGTRGGRRHAETQSAKPTFSKQRRRPPGGARLESHLLTATNWRNRPHVVPFHATVDRLFFPHLRNPAVPIGGGHAAIHEEVAAADEATLRSHE